MAPADSPILRLTAATSRPLIPWRELWAYRDLIRLLVTRDLTLRYKQSVLGPIWFLLQPLLPALLFSLVFSGFAGLSTDQAPPSLFYLLGLLLWGFFADSVTLISEVFAANQALFGSFRFPRLAVPLAYLLSKATTLAWQAVVLLAFWGGALLDGSIPAPGLRLLAVPLVVLDVALLALGAGLLIAAVTVRYRDLRIATPFALQLGLFASPIIYPLSSVAPAWRPLFWLNPMAAPLELFRGLFLGTCALDTSTALASLVWGAALLAAGLLLFRRAERTQADFI